MKHETNLFVPKTNESKWTHVPPTKEGWYWKREFDNFEQKMEITCVYVRWYVTDFAIGNTNIHAYDKAEWAGPIQPPK